ncbi:hypothetical protein WJX72_009596 [[Myrmecia] bisecta]|uniref:Uncharacterized protein n=1 Tax=[Myrmecia] bisecta TaxID=41462 RepID=A0AAW1Q513_9CHLO
MLPPGQEANQSAYKVQDEQQHAAASPKGFKLPASQLATSRGLSAECRWRLRKASQLEDKLERARKMMAMEVLQQRAQQLTPEPFVRSTSNASSAASAPSRHSSHRTIRTLGNLRSATDTVSAEQTLFYYPAHRLRSTAWGAKEFAQTMRAGQLLKSRRLQFVTGALEQPALVQGTLQHELSRTFPDQMHLSGQLTGQLASKAEAISRAASQASTSYAHRFLCELDRTHPSPKQQHATFAMPPAAEPHATFAGPSHAEDFSKLLQLESLDEERERVAREEALEEEAEAAAGDAMLDTLEREHPLNSLPVITGHKNNILAATAWRPAANHPGLTHTLRMKLAAADLVYDEDLDSPVALAKRGEPTAGIEASAG